MSQIERAQKIYCIGDSHCLPLRDVIYRSAIEATPFLVSAHYISGFSASDMIGTDGEVGPKLRSVLKSLELLRDDGATAWTGFDRSAETLTFEAISFDNSTTASTSRIWTAPSPPSPALPSSRAAMSNGFLRQSFHRSLRG
jgi:hypothetical protein